MTFTCVTATGTNVILASAGITCQTVVGGAAATFAVTDAAAASKCFTSSDSCDTGSKVAFLTMHSWKTSVLSFSIFCSNSSVVIIFSYIVSWIVIID